ncbi:unnamed protein product [Linum trigynum]|uniref:Uncharacterized protein n=1 Tax=Linum trigynum TaxID=586398 RepID=A0AAV2FCH1_9ROSI
MLNKEAKTMTAQVANHIVRTRKRPINSGVSITGRHPVTRRRPSLRGVSSIGRRPSPGASITKQWSHKGQNCIVQTRK